MKNKLASEQDVWATLKTGFLPMILIVVYQNVGCFPEIIFRQNIHFDIQEVIHATMATNKGFVHLGVHVTNEEIKTMMVKDLK